MLNDADSYQGGGNAGGSGFAPNSETALCICLSGEMEVRANSHEINIQ